MTLKKIEMPNLGESVTEASVSVWLVKEGDKINKYDPIAEAVSDKVTTEIPSNYTGVIKEFLIDLDTDVEIGTAILSIETDEEDEKEKEGERTEEFLIDLDTDVEIGTAILSIETDEEDEKEGERTEEFMEHINEEIDKEAEKQPIQRNTQAELQASSKNTSNKNKARYSPAVVRIAQERDIDLNQVEGTGKHGRITRKDVQNFDVTSEKETSVQQSEIQHEPAAVPAPSSHDNEATVVPADGVRKAIAKKMVQSSTEIPHAWLMVEADVTNIVTLRNETKHQFKEQEGVSLSFFPFFVKAVVQALKKHPIINTSWDNNSIIYHKDINLSIAVATDEHLFVPVIHQADQYSIVGLTKEINRLATSAREGKLQTKDMQGGTMTLNNTGTFGSVQSMGIINHPQAAILQVESISKRFVPTNDGGFKAADMVNLCLSIDHRIIDGLQAGRFLQDVKENLAKFNDEANLY